MVDGLNRVDGLASGIPSQDLIDATIEAARIPALLKEQRAEFMGLQQEAVRTLNLRLLSAQLDTSDLRQGRAFNSKSVSSSNESVASVTANSSAVLGTYSMSVNALAVSEQRATAGMASATTSNGTGSITIQVGEGAQTTIDVSDGATSLKELADRINDENIGVTAFVIDDGSGASSQRLVLQSDETGQANTVKVTGTDDMAALFGNESDAMTLLQAGADAELSLGALTIYSASNSVDSVVPGVTLELKDTGALTVSVGNDTSEAETAITTFVESVNSALEYFRDNSGYDVENNEAGLLFSEGDLRRSLGSLVSDMLNTVSSGSKSTLLSVGISYNSDDGIFDLDAAALSDALSTDPEGVRQLFANTGTSSQAGLNFAVLDDRTQLDGSPLSVSVTQIAEQASFTGSDLAASTIITEGSNDSFEFRLGNTNHTIAINAGTYSRDEMVTQIQAAMDSAIGSDRVVVDRDGDALRFTSVAYGTSSVIGVQSGTPGQALTDLGLSVGNFLGKDVEGTINGTAATGSGQTLKASDDSDLAGLVLTVTSSSTFTDAAMTVERGLGQIANETLFGLTDSQDGLLTQKDNFFGTEIEFLNESVERIDANLLTMRTGLEAQFLAMERTIAGLQSQEQFLAGQITAFQNMAASRASGG